MKATFRMLLATIVIAAAAGSRLFAGEELLIRAVVDGKQTSLYEKVVVTSAKATLAKEPGDQGDPIEPFAIFFHLKTDRGELEQNGYVRVGDSSGNPFGWIKACNVTFWNTRFVLEPTQPLPDRAFSVVLENDTKATLKTIPEGKRRFALISKSASGGDDPAYPVVVYAGNVQGVGSAGTLARERNQLRDLKLEIMFVLESTDFMLCTFDGVNQFDSMKGVIKQAIEAIQGNSELRGAVRLGLAEYQDSVPKAKFVSRLTCPLTDDYSKFESAVKQLEPTELDDDWPDDVIAGLNEAISDRAGWSENSSKHVILLGSASCQIYHEGQQPSQFGGDWNVLTKRSAQKKPYGWSSTGLSTHQLIGRANSQGGSGPERARAAKTFHTILGGKELPHLSSDLEGFVEKVVHMTDGELAAFVERLEQNGKDLEVLRLCFQYYLIQYQRGLARTQYKELSRNDGVEGICLVVEPKAEDIKRGAEQLVTRLIESFQQLAGIRTGTVGTKELEQRSNEITQTFYAIVGAAAEKFKDQPVLQGLASVRDERGREVAHKKILVSRAELQRLRSTLDAIHKKFKTRVARADRQDVSQILKEFQEIITQTSAGQAKFAEDAKLQDIISDLPLRTTVLETTPRDLAVMPSDAFQQWLNKLEAAIFRGDDLLNGKAEWLVLSEKAQNDQFTFLNLNELP